MRNKINQLSQIHLNQPHLLYKETLRDFSVTLVNLGTRIFEPQKMLNY